MKFYSALIIFLISQIAISQIVINELDCDTPSTDILEFIELKSDVPNYSLDGYIVVLFNGSASGADSSYFSIDLTGYSTDVNGLLLIGSNSVSPVPQLLISADIIQNGADAVAIYLASWEDFPGGTLATTTNLIDALVYDTSDPDDAALMSLLGITEQINENENGNKDNESIQRNNDGTYTVKAPTPRQLNDGSGVVLNGVFISIDQTQYDEGDVFDITITTEQNVTEQLDLEIVLDNGTFDASDFTGNTLLLIPIGQNLVSTTIALVDDNDDEGDEVLNIMLFELPEGYLQLNNNLKIRVVDDDFTIAAWGIPTSPTYGMVTSSQPNGYYNSLDGLADTALRQALQDIIANPSVVRAQTYTDVIDILKQADQNPANSNEVWLVYTEQGRPKLDFQTGSNNTGTWNREHTYPRSRGGFESIDLDDVADGPDVFWATKADSLRHGNSDAHALRAVDGPENSSRGNQNYGPAEYDGPSGNVGSFKGDLARSVLYMTVRYNGIEVVNGYPTASPSGQLGDLATLLEWHRSDPPDDFEMNRNNIIYTWQFNRNPFIDQPDLVEYIWGNKLGEFWDQSLSAEDESIIKVKIYPNPTKGEINIRGIEETSFIKIYNSQGVKVFENKYLGNVNINLNLSSGVYLMNIIQDHKSIFKKVVID
ncbi:endonuclease [Yeosuana sp. MJ-SS3]|uniref:Endonuclease n=1 Tax=Gilvirhabdus luticola TaxID=3079858 RepID=A0ABU3U6K8_9FLAO|nr:endonuclease [Yeosuana sp. MJ-SS3]MDU8886044.1 endonuclease [Yeosuana sp. MJ-SS3]